MTRSTHTYTAVLVGSPDVPLNVYQESAGTFTLDASNAPHVSGSLVIDPPLTATLTALLPTQSPPPRVKVTVAATFPSFSQSRVFNLSVRGWSIRQDDNRVALDLASDEALLRDYRALTDDKTPLNHQSSLRALVNYVIGQAIPSASLNTSLSAADVAIPALSESDNIIRNPRVAIDTTDWGITGSAAVNRETSGGPSGISAAYYRAVPTAGATGVAIHIDENTVAVRPNVHYNLIAYVYAQSTQSVSLDGWLIDQNGTVITSCAPATATPAGSWVKLVCSFRAPETSATFRPRLSVNGSALALTVGMTAVRFSVDSGDPNDRGYWDGSTTDTANYSYDWSNTAHASSSKRTVLIDAATPDALTWRAGTSALDFLAPLVQRFGLRMVCDEARVWTLRDATFTAPGLLSIRYAVNMTDGVISISRDSSLWFDARVTRYRWRTPDGLQYEQVDSYTLNTPPTLVTYMEIDSAYPGAGRSQYAVERAQGRGREVTASSVADWAAKAEQGIIVLLDGLSTQTGITQSITFDLGNDEMTVVTRTVDTPLGAIDLLTGTINALTGTINGL